jgi:hypothetical protein
MTTDVATPVATEVRAGEDTPRWRRALTGEWARTFAVVFAWHVILTGVAYLFQGTYPVYPGNPVQTLGPDQTLLSHTYRWDSGHFNGILNGEYTNPETPWAPAFYPFFPVCVWLVQTVTFGQLGFLAAGFVVNLIASWFAATALLKITRHFTSSTWAPWLAVGAFLSAPTAFFMHAFYSEAVFCAFGFWAFLFALRQRWAWMGLCLIPTTATRITAALFVGLCLLEFFRAKQWKLRGLLSWHLLWFPGAYLGFAAFVGYMKVALNEPLAMFHAYNTAPAWRYHVFDLNIFSTIGTEVETSVTALANPPIGNWALISHIIPMIGLAVLLIASVYLWYRLRAQAIPLALFGIASIVMFTLNSNVVSVHRYLVPCIVIYVAMAVAAERSARLKPVMYGLMFAHALTQAFIYSLFISGNWSG